MNRAPGRHQNDAVKHHPLRIFQQYGSTAIAFDALQQEGYPVAIL